MKWFLVLMLLALPVSLEAQAAGRLVGAAFQPSKSAPRFVSVAVFVDPQGSELGAYQCEVCVRGAKLVGIEGGESDAFSNPPYYDAAALAGDRVIIGAFSLKTHLPTTKTRVARLHVMVESQAEVKFETHVQAAADRDGKEIVIQASAALENDEVNQ